jgi:hypothetical protein
VCISAGKHTRIPRSLVRPVRQVAQLWSNRVGSGRDHLRGSRSPDTTYEIMMPPTRLECMHARNLLRTCVNRMVTNCLVGSTLNHVLATPPHPNSPTPLSRAPRAAAGSITTDTAKP